MLAWRSLLRRHNLLTSCLRPVRRHGATQAAALYGQNLTASRGYASHATDGDSHQPAAASKKRHLYLLLDDHKKNYGIYRMDVDADLDDGVGSKAPALAPRRLPRPALIRLEVPTARPLFVAEGGCIIGKGCFPRPYWGMHLFDDEDSTVVYDIKTATLSIATDGDWGLPQNPRTRAVHPREGTVFVSASKWAEIRTGVINTFSFDTTTAEWTHRGTSALPFKGHAGYDGELDAWLGFHADDRGKCTGHLVACRSPSREHQWPPHSQVTGEKVLVEDPGWRRVDAKLVHMVERGEYCLVERLRREGTNKKERLLKGDECLLRLTTFRVGLEQYGLAITDRRTSCSYNVSRYRQEFELRAFWI
ncbi:unnamed protein product [Alopecurus aequalis]